jgi:hypothetical protein
MPWTAFADISPRTVLLTAGVSFVTVAVPWAAIYTTFGTIFADTDAASAVWGGIITLFITKLFDWIMLRENNRKLNALAEVVGTKPTKDSPTLVEQAGTLGTAATLAATEAQKASLRAKVAVQQVVENEKRAERGREVLAQVASHTNGEFAAIKAENAELRRWKEAQLAASVPPAVVEKIDHLTEVVEEVVETSKSGTKLGKPARDPNARERATDQPN